MTSQISLFFISAVTFSFYPVQAIARVTILTELYIYTFFTAQSILQRTTKIIILKDKYAFYPYYVHIASTTFPSSLHGKMSKHLRMRNSMSLTIWPQPSNVPTTASSLLDKHFKSSVSLHIWFFRSGFTCLYLSLVKSH